MALVCLKSILPVPPTPPVETPPPRSLRPMKIETETPTLFSSSVNQSRSPHAGSRIKPIEVWGDPPTFVSAPGRRILAVGDLHGDLAQARSALEMAGVLSSDGHYQWTGGGTVLIQLGDVVDRGEDDIAILSLLRSLDIQARAQGGAVFQLNGNHETMNVEGDFRFVDPRAFDECLDFLKYLNDYQTDWESAFVGWVGASQQWKEARKLSQKYWRPWDVMKRQRGINARSTLLKPAGPLACELARHPVVLKVDDWVFCHGGLLPHHVAYGIQRMNREVSQWMRGHCESGSDTNIPFVATGGYDSVVWNRLYSKDNSDFEACQIKQIASVLEETLEAVGAKAMIVGHTPQTAGVNCKYNCGVWCIDVGMSSGVLNSRPEVLEIRDNAARVIRSEGDTSCDSQMIKW